MYNFVLSDFHNTKHYALLKEKADRLASDCKNNLGSGDYVFVENLADSLIALCAAEAAFAYRRGLSDCLCLLQRLAQK